jgi:SET domain-containing protein
MILPALFVAAIDSMGRGVFTSEFLPVDSIIEISPVIVMTAAERVFLDQTTLHDYIFEWGPDRKDCCMALGYIPIYNHSYSSNCEYEMDFDDSLIRIKTMRDIEAGEELLINYNGDWNDTTPIWFDAV